MDGRIGEKGDYFKNAARMIGDKTRLHRMTATMQTAFKSGSNRTIRSSQSDVSTCRLKRRSSLAGLRGRTENASFQVMFLADM